MTVDTAQTPDEVPVDRAAGLDLFEIDRITLRRKFESLYDEAESTINHAAGGRAGQA